MPLRTFFYLISAHWRLRFRTDFANISFIGIDYSVYSLPPFTVNPILIKLCRKSIDS
uniref:Uncharacterized protein n=1 Tax=Anguilla anguilla TaxID=7936 RepID=A0A0E9X0C9_ANGAN